MRWELILKNSLRQKYKIENSHKNYTKQWRKIYKVIQQELFDETAVSLDKFLKHFKNKVYEDHSIPIDAKNNIK